MKKLILLFLIIVFALSGCKTVNENVESSSTCTSSEPVYSSSSQISSIQEIISSSVPTSSQEPTISESYSSDTTTSSEPPAEEIVTAIDSNEMRAVWISYFEYEIKNFTYDQFKEKINTMFNNIASLGLNTVIVHVRSNADAFYESAYFPWSAVLTGVQGKDPGYDPLEYMVTAAHKRNIKIHAWINPFRISNTSGDITTLCENHIARVWANNPATQDRVISYNNKIYFNPAIPEVQELIINGVREIVNKYAVDGIHFDDYFYPNADESFDSETYRKYAADCSAALSLTEWRTANISSLISAVKRVVNSKSIPFGVSPSAHIGQDFLQKNGFADIKSWMACSNYVDYIMPQIYWGFDYPSDEYRFHNMVSSWTALERHSSVKLYVGLAYYKAGTYDKNDEWINNNDIIMREISHLRNTSCGGFSLFSYSYVFSDAAAPKAERDNILSVLK